MAQLLKNYPKARFFVKLLLLILPLAPAVAIYLLNDPYMMLRSYKRFDGTQVALNEAYVGWQNIVMNKDSLHYDSFILGNSCTMAYNTREWQKHLEKGTSAVRFFDNAETLGGVEQKLESLDSLGLPIRNVLIVLDCIALKDTSPLRRNYNLYSANVAGVSNLEFQMKAMQQFLYPEPLWAYLKFSVTHRYDPSMKGYIMKAPATREPFTNNFTNPREKQIATMGERYWTVEHKAEFMPRHPGSERVIVRGAHIAVLRKIKAICAKRHAQLTFIIGPDYQQCRLRPRDLALLKRELGAMNVWNFTGVNAFTRDIHNYYEPGHYRPVLGGRILDYIYAERAKAQNLNEMQPNGRQ